MFKSCWKEIAARDKTYVIIDQLKALIFFKCFIENLLPLKAESC